LDDATISRYLNVIRYYNNIIGMNEEDDNKKIHDEIENTIPFYEEYKDTHTFSSDAELKEFLKIKEEYYKNMRIKSEKIYLESLNRDDNTTGRGPMGGFKKSNNKKTLKTAKAKKLRNKKMM
jgi:alcohol dehydrogenase YqhD (iron-dependent ADH family)